MNKFEDDVWSMRMRKRALRRKRRWDATLIVAVLMVLGLMAWFVVIGSAWLTILFAGLFICSALLLVYFLYLECWEEVGASKGTSTPLIRFDIDYATPLAHGHPILKSEVPSGADVIRDGSRAFPDEFFIEFFHDIDEP